MRAVYGVHLSDWKSYGLDSGVGIEGSNTLGYCKQTALVGPCVNERG